MNKKFKNKATLTLRVIYGDNITERVTGPAEDIRMRFYTLVLVYITNYVEPVTIQLLDNREKVFKEFIQHF